MGCVCSARHHPCAEYALLGALVLISIVVLPMGRGQMGKKAKTKSSTQQEGSTNPGDYLADVPTKLVSGVLGLMGFATASLVGLVAGNPGILIIVRAIVAMLICSIVGRILGAIGEVCVREFVNRYKVDRPQPKKPKELIDLDLKQQAHMSVIETMNRAA